MKKWVILALMVLLPTMAFGEKSKVYVYNWTEYLPDGVISAFEKETGIEVVYSTYDSNESMYAKVKLLKGKGYDLIFPSTYFVHRMRNEGLLAPVDRSKLTRFDNLDPLLLDKPYDPGNIYSIPYVWGSSAIAYNQNYVDKEKVSSWKDLWRPEFKNRLVMLDDLRDVLGVGLIVNGFSVNETNPDNIRKAFESIKTLMPNIRVFSGDSPKQPLMNLEVHAGLIWNGEAYMASQEFPAIKYSYPGEGAIFWVDSMCIPKNAKNKDGAHRFIDFILKPEMAKIICDYVGYAPANRAAMEIMEQELRDNPMVFPDPSTVEKGEFQTDVGEAILIYEHYWEKLKTGL